ncbi:hypothetical protein BLAT2472_30391 [Burkholderia latens]
MIARDESVGTCAGSLLTGRSGATACMRPWPRAVRRSSPCGRWKRPPTERQTRHPARARVRLAIRLRHGMNLVIRNSISISCEKYYRRYIENNARMRAAPNAATPDRRLSRIRRFPQ